MLTENQITGLYNELGSRIKAERKKAKYSQKECAEHLGISRSSLVNVERGRQRPPIHFIYSIAKLFQIEITALLPNPTNISENDIDESIILEIKKTSKGDIVTEESLKRFVKESRDQAI